MAAAFKRLESDPVPTLDARATIFGAEASIVIAPSRRPVYDVWTRTRSNGGEGVRGRHSHFGGAHRLFKPFAGAVEDPLDERLCSKARVGV